MKHLILDPECKYDPRYCNYRFHLNSGYKTDYFKVSEDVPVNEDGTCKKNEFVVIKSSKTGYHRIIKGEDRTQRCLVMLSANTVTKYETPEIDEDFTTCQILETYNVESNVNGLKIIAVLYPRRPLIVKYTNRITNKVRCEIFIYDSVNEQVISKELPHEDLMNIVQDSVLLHDSDVDTQKFKITPENFLFNMKKEDEKKAQEWYDRYHSFMKDA